MYYFDTETTGFNGVCVLIQYSTGADITLHEVWKRPCQETLDLIERMCEEGVVAFNLSFDMFHLQKLYCMLTMLRDHICPHALPIDHVQYLYDIEPDARFVDKCLKPKQAIDLMLHGARGEFQSLMKRKEIRIRRVPAFLAPILRDHLTETHKIDPIYGATFSVTPTEKRDGRVDPGWNDVVLKFKGNMKLKSFAKILLGEEVDTFDEVMPDVMSQEEGFAPWAKAWKGRLADKNNAKKGLRKDKPYITWDEVIHDHVEFWATDERARTYATRDVEYLVKLHKRPEFEDADPGNFDHILAVHVGTVKWRGFPINIPGFKRLREKYVAIRDAAPCTAGKECLEYLRERLSPDRYALILKKGTSQEVIEKLEEAWKDSPEAIEPIAAVSAARKAANRVNTIDKLLIAGRWHPDYNVSGAKSNRMSGTGGVNAQGFPRQKEFRNLFLIREALFDAQFGDFDSHEIAIAAAVYDDPELNKDLESGKSFHGLFGESMYEIPYEEVIADEDKYHNAKRGGFGMNYGGNWMTLLMRGLVDTEEQAKRTEKHFFERYKGIIRLRTEMERSYKSMHQDPHTKQVYYEKPKDYVESPLGFRRSFTHENKIVKFLYDLACNLPKKFYAFDGSKIVRNKLKGPQNPSGTIMSALFLAAFNLQNANARAAINHVMQSVGGETCKDLQARLANLQPPGVHPWKIATFNAHDEVGAAVHEDIKEEPKRIVQEVLDHYRPTIKFIGMDWETDRRFWKDDHS